MLTLAFLLTCFDGKAQASKIRKSLAQDIDARGGAILDEVVLRVDAQGKALVYDPRRTVAGTLTPALTWGLFGALTGGGWSGVVTWAIIGGIGGGLLAYYMEHSLTKNELKRVGERMPPDSSAFAAFIRTADATAILHSTAPYSPTTASIAAIGEPLRARVWSDAASPVESTVAAPAPQDSEAPTLLSLVILRCKGEHTIRDVMTRMLEHDSIQPELLFEVDKSGKTHVTAPTTGVKATAKSSSPWWAGFGLIFGFAAGWSGDGGVLSSLQDGLVTAIAWGLFGLCAGALYGLWAGRAISARRLKGVSPILRPDTSAMIAWADGAVTHQTLSELSTPETESLALRFRAEDRGVVIAGNDRAES